MLTHLTQHGIIRVALVADGKYTCQGTLKQDELQL